MTYFSLLPSTIITVGIKKSCIVDIEKSLFAQIPNGMASFFRDKRNFEIEKELELFCHEERMIIEDYISFLVNHNFAIIHNCKKIAFKYIEETYRYKSPFALESIIIDAKTKEDLLYFLSFLPTTQITNLLQLRLFFCVGFSFLLLLAKKLKYLRVELVIQYNPAIEDDDYHVLLNHYSSTISRVVVMGTKEKKQSNNRRLFYTIEPLIGDEQCGKIRKSMFMTNIESYLISCSGNSCLYKKISIDSSGNIKNCPSMQKTYGHVSKIKLEDVIVSDEFKKYWKIKKSNIDVCKDCEFRNICIDCRAFITYPNNIFSQPKKCKYNPYLAKWEDEDGWISVEQWRNKNQN
ncbi:MAG: grasp-with-spasm system SPASM domain peptide maturase [Bacteroidales bacterium]|jgi:SPASM domain peptide maturase of grasp-with-spasm system|nr:grasp-with-spasm system SPASM domain peptide maturase [Bacteroidales bacterium]MDD2771237.1 grasp-with-spasm system SPASM domain peptide maturase [Bacteroidales bacterium]MDD3105086.1 grasp-with-spasm system SPASM domain peptide maturase [Bacteroidales bacterium]MDD3549928.1 grasp-with-spasm system SPASM domain peptide maturase [Bacteroidales bacterium]MDY0182307.1 grasp-with-spasm system SPASM domain peptide maturase [Proteiniphilum sp.]